ncbi:MAG: efflux RND transporter periplasmic adaptor subunit [Planctomycetes bacterium]|nr:efflux RND transporter periplasmic adaptor subunit [Planctomycetota bacterium]
MNRKLLLGIAVAVAVGAYFVPWQKTGNATEQPGARELFTVRRADLNITLTESGRLVAKESTKVKAQIKGEGKITFLVEEGKEVRESDIVCKLDPTQAQSQVEETQLEILQTEQNLKTARTELEIQQVENTATIAKSVVALDRAKQELEKYRDGEAPQERRKLEVAIKDAETDWNRAKKNLDDSAKLLEQNYIKKSELEDHQITFERAVVQRDGAELALRIFDKYTFPMAMTDLSTKLADAEREISTAKKRAESTLGQKEVAVQQVEKRLKVQQDQLKERKEDLENMIVKAPSPGLVVYGDPHEPWYRERTKVGGQIYGGFTLLTIPDLRVMQVKLQIHEADISKVKVGLPATITTDSYPGLLLHGEVSKIATMAGGSSDWSGQSEVRKFDVEVTVKTPDGTDLKPGISAKCEIHAEKRENTLFVPLQSVFSEDGEHFCHVLHHDATAAPGPQRTKVKIGPANDTYVEICEGIAEGDAVLLYNPSLAETRHDKKPGAKPAVAEKSAQEQPVEASASKKTGA